MRPVKIQSIEDRLAEVDRVIMNTSQAGCDLIRRGAPVSEIDAQTGFLNTLFKRREVILHELAKAGISERDAYKHLRGGDTAQ